MNAPVVLLIEDTDSDAELFKNQIRQEVGGDVVIVWKRNLREGKEYLAKNVVDQIWLDRVLPDFNDKDFDVEIAEIRSIVPPGSGRSQSVAKNQFFLLSSSVPREIRKKAEQQEIQIVSKDALLAPENSQVLRLILEMMEKKGMPTTARIDIAKQDIRLLNLEGRVEQFQQEVKEFRALISSFILESKTARQSAELEAVVIRNAIAKIPELEKELKAQKSGDTLKIERWKIFGSIIGGIVVALSAITVAFFQFALPKLMDQTTQQIKQEVQRPTAPPSKSPAPNK